MKENVLDNPVEVRRAVPQPHFDDQRVVRRAQRVVPLQEIRSRVRLRKLLYLGFAFVIAIMLGAASALVAVRVKQTPVTNNTEPEVETTDSAPIITESVAIEPASVEEKVEPKKQAPLPERPRVTARQNIPPIPERRGVEPSEEEELQQIRESILYERWQKRRARRVMRRERRSRSDRDLSRVDELFEGPRRPERPY